MHFHAAGGTIATVWTALNANVTQNMWLHTLNTAAVNTVTITDLTVSTASQQFSTGRPLKWSGGTGAGDVAPQVAAIVKELTAGRGRSKRGRLFLPWCAENQIQDGKLLAATVTSMQTAWNTFYSAMNAANVVPTVASYTHISDELVTQFLVESLLGTQRLRQPR